MKKISIGLLFGFLSFMAWSQSSTYLWPTILFVKGQDLCQFEESYGTTRIEQVNEMTGQLKDLMRYGATTSEGVSALLNLDAMTDRQRAQATAGNRMDVTLEASLKAYLDRMYLGFSPSDVKLKFFNPGPLGELIKNLKLAEIGLRKQTPLIQIIERPHYPLEHVGLRWWQYVLGGLGLGLALAFYLVYLGWLKSRSEVAV